MRNPESFIEQSNYKLLNQRVIWSKGSLLLKIKKDWKLATEQFFVKTDLRMQCITVIYWINNVKLLNLLKWDFGNFELPEFIFLCNLFDLFSLYFTKYGKDVHAPPKL